MKIDGRNISAEILEELKIRVAKLAKRGVTPHLYIILLSSDAFSASYVKQKQIKGEKIGVKITLDKENPGITTANLVKKIKKLNKDANVHGIIVQRPMSKTLNEEIIANTIIPEKDVDGFNKNSNFSVPVARAIFTILENAHPQGFDMWISHQKIAIIGRGITAGQPIINAFKNINITPEIITSKTKDKKTILKACNIIISAVGKESVIKKDELNNGVILVGVGLHKKPDGKYYGDYNEEEIKDKASYYSPTPGGVGPVNVSCLLANLVEAAENY